MKLLMLGTGPFAVPTLRRLVAAGHSVPLVVSRPFRGRKNAPKPPMHEAAVELGIELWTPESVNLPESVERLESLNVDLLVVCDYGEILKPAALATTRLGGINLHGSLLPKYRGAAPVQWAVLNGDPVAGNTVIQMTAGLDAGPCLAQQRVPVDPDETAGQLEERLAELGAEAVVEVVAKLADGTAEPVEQVHAERSKAPRLAKQDGELHWSDSAAAIKNRVRAMSPWPRAYGFWQIEGREPLRVVIDRVQLVERAESVEPGSAITDGNQLLVATGDGWLEIIDLQPAGKRAMAAADFLRGYSGGRFVNQPGSPE
ncbi:methionyl-tRNA formyltransferase [Aeoliella mucimassa]|uniref:Methionyl-tRNA formyltransferase n=1 Tax=Aeoliella mucimassa TaxID=2527972 RepID=A0A518AIK1_9BACT|nr:methionyl-tRNA formyltransferase [Aeoliella mucimassa]QDU54546.1 Methionyl-tRNA formyltransferase [Aeoliella mucimassa]